MQNNLFLTIYGISLPLFSGNEVLRANSDQRPNILCIVCEDISPYLGCYGDPVAVTPNLDNFSKEAITDAGKHPEYYEAIRLNISLLKQATHNGLLYDGMHYKTAGMKPCIHHIFGHAKALASFLALPVATPPRVLLPRDKEYGVEYFEDINTWLVAEDDWRATVTGFDAEYKVKGTHPMGGALSMLWHKKTGLVFAATMNKFSMIEPPNMQSYLQENKMPGTPRVELQENGYMYSNLNDLQTEINYHKKGGAHIFCVSTHLVNSEQAYSSLGNSVVEITYTFDAGNIHIRCKGNKSLAGKGIKLVLPVISDPEEKAQRNENDLSIKKQHCSLILKSKSILQIAPTDPNGRIFNPVPGFSFIPVVIEPGPDDEMEVTLAVEK